MELVLGTGQIKRPCLGCTESCARGAIRCPPHNRRVPAARDAQLVLLKHEREVDEAGVVAEKYFVQEFSADGIPAPPRWTAIAPPPAVVRQFYDSRAAAAAAAGPRPARKRARKQAARAQVCASFGAAVLRGCSCSAVMAQFLNF